MADRVLFTASTCSHIATFHRPYLRAFRNMGWEVHVACGGPPLALPEADKVLILPFEKKMSSPSNFRAQKLLRSAMERNRYTLICTHTSLAAFFTRRACAGWHDRPPLVNVAHGYLFGPDTPFWKKSILLAAEKMTAPQTDLLLTMNRWDCETACRCRLGKTVEQIPGVGVEFSRFDAPPAVSRPALRRRLGLEQEDFVLIYPAEFSARKNQAMLLRALARLPDSVKLLLPGQGAQLDACRSLSAALRLESRVIFPGQISDMSSWYHAADAAVSVSRSEGLPFNVMEAMYCRLPVAASAVKGHTDLLCDGVSGLLFPADSIDLLVQKLSALQTSPELRRGLTDSAFDAVQPYSLERVLPPVMEKYLSVLPRAARIGAEVR